MSNAALEGLALRKGADGSEEGGEAATGEDRQQLGEETLAKIRSGELKLEEDSVLRSFDPGTDESEE
jgi:hypothetical protein